MRYRFAGRATMPKTVMALVFLLALSLRLMGATPAEAQVTLNKLSTDTFTNSSSQHATEVEPDTLSFGSTIVSTFQVGRIFGGGAADIGWATSTDGGNTWTNGFLPGLTITGGGGKNSAASDPAVAYDAAHGIWIICTLPIATSGATSVAVSRSSDGISWGNPIVLPGSSNADKNWIVCDSNPASPFFGHCYAEWDNTASGDTIKMSTSTDGGQTWGTAQSTAARDTGIGGQPLVQPNGTVVVPFEGLSGSMKAFTSTNGGTSWNAAVKVATIQSHGVAGGLRTSPLPSAELDSAGTVYVVWQDCRFRASCKENDIVMSTSADGNIWTAVRRIPIDPTTSTVDHFIPGLAVDITTAGSTAHLSLTYYYYSNASCSKSTCQLFVGHTSSQNGGRTWSAFQQLAGPMNLTNLPNTFSGLMVGDYISTSYSESLAHGVFAVANPKNGTKFDEATYTTAAGLTSPENVPEFSSAGERPVPGTVSDHGPMEYYDLDHRIPIPPEERPIQDPPDYD
jgi:hypothetical protein